MQKTDKYDVIGARPRPSSSMISARRNGRLSAASRNSWAWTLCTRPTSGKIRFPILSGRASASTSLRKPYSKQPKPRRNHWARRNQRTR